MFPSEPCQQCPARLCLQVPASATGTLCLMVHQGRTPKLIPHTRCPGCCCNRSTFYFVLHTIRDHPRLQRNCRGGDYLKPEEQLAIALSYLAQGGSFSLVGGLWGCSVTSVHRCVNAVSHAIRARLSSFMALPSTDEEWQELVVGFSDFVRLRWGIQVGLPQVVLAMDGCQVPIMHAPPNTGLPGRCHDFYCFERSGLGRQLMDRGSNVVQAFERGARLLGGTTVPYLICADSAYPSRRYILPAFKPNETQGNAAYLSYNLKHGSTRNVIERAFGQVKSRFRCLHHGVRTDVTITPYVIFMFLYFPVRLAICLRSSSGSSKKGGPPPALPHQMPQVVTITRTNVQIDVDAESLSQ
ncbi:DDE Tnp4 domain-containing protein [Haematococcus lacustris]|uniref:DDE Tnp4 domain-containing protein n=1 Tax=Haematococcus lacustris TaxID=44745 RepID=A0A699ZZL9_HAELA|nr:DDE Tnp4 domain-containing protein [Haematococcus lacustris]